MEFFVYTPVIMILLALVYKYFPPRKINNLYGYRTWRSKRSQQVWDEGNRYSANAILLIGFVVLLLSAISHALLTLEIAIISVQVATVGGLLLSIPLTERHLKKHFDEDGKPK